MPLVDEYDTLLYVILTLISSFGLLHPHHNRIRQAEPRPGRPVVKDVALESVGAGGQARDIKDGAWSRRHARKYWASKEALESNRIGNRKRRRIRVSTA